jgi:mannose-6-phosphate isomerase-like protein (cupin superfamily)
MKDNIAETMQKRKHEPGRDMLLYGERCASRCYTVWQRVREGESMHSIIHLSEIQINSTAYRFEGRNYGDIVVSFFLVHTEPGNGPSLHTHPYEEVFIVQEGEVTFVVGTETLTVTGGNVVIAPPETPHKFTNSGTTPLRQLSIHPTKEIITTWLEE